MHFLNEKRVAYGFFFIQFNLARACVTVFGIRRGDTDVHIFNIVM